MFSGGLKRGHLVQYGLTTIIDCWRIVEGVYVIYLVEVRLIETVIFLGGNSETPSYFWYFFILPQAKWTPAVVSFIQNL